MSQPEVEKDSSGMKSYAKYSSVAFQMIASVGVMAALGWYLDGYLELEKNYLTALFSLIGVLAGLYLVLKEIISK